MWNLFFVSTCPILYIPMYTKSIITVYKIYEKVILQGKSVYIRSLKCELHYIIKNIF